MILNLLAFGKDFRNVKPIKTISKTENKVILEQNGFIHKIQVRNSNTDALAKNTSEGTLDTILRFIPPDSVEHYDTYVADIMALGCSYGLKDTVIKSFELIAPGTIRKVMMQNASEGTAELQFWGPCFYQTETSRYVQLPEYSYESDGVQIPEAKPLLTTSLQMDCDAQDPEEQFNDSGKWTPVWNIFDVDSLYSGDNPLLTGDSLELWIGYSTDGVSGPTILMDGKSQEAVRWGWDVWSHFTLKAQYPYSGGYLKLSETDEETGLIYGSNHIMQIVVEYPATPPIIESVTELSNILTTSAVIQAEIFDIDSESFTAQVQYKVGQDGSERYINMTATDEDSVFEATVSGSVGDTIYYVVKADDGELSQYSADTYSKFVIKEKSEEQKYLVIVEGSTNNDSLYQEVLRDEETLYWIMEDEGGLHKSVVNAGFDVIFVTGYGTTVVPIFDEEDIYEFGSALDNGTDLILSDPEWAYANELSKSLTYIKLQKGDFAYDYFGIDTLINDPCDEEYEPLADSVFNGFSEQTLTSNFSDTVSYGPLRYNYLGISENWGDFVSDNNSDESSIIFVGANNGYAAAVSNVNDYYKTAYFAFWPEVIDSSQFDKFKTLVENILGQVTGVVEESETVATEFTLKQNYPNPFNPTTRIEYTIPERSQVSLKIYDISGNLVRTLNSGMKNQGRYAVTWDAKNEFGHRVSSGVYFYKLQAADNVVTKKMLLMK